MHYGIASRLKPLRRREPMPSVVTMWQAATPRWSRPNSGIFFFFVGWRRRSNLNIELRPPRRVCMWICVYVVCVNVCVCMCACVQPHRNPCFSWTCGSNPRKSMNKGASKKTPINSPTNSDHDCDAASHSILFRVFKKWYMADRLNKQAMFGGTWGQIHKSRVWKSRHA